MTKRAAAIVKSTDPDATVVCPSMGHLWQEEGRATLRRFAELGGYEHCDAAGVKLYQRNATDPPETLVRLLTDIDRTMHAAGVHPPLWNTGTTYDIPLRGSLDATGAVNYALRFYLAGLYGREVGVERMYFYNWGSGRLPLVLQAEGSPPTSAVNAVATLQQWLVGAQLHSCGAGAPAGLPSNVWQCEFTQDGHRTAILWTHAGTAHIANNHGTALRTAIDGTMRTLGPTTPIQITETPALITYT